MRLYKAKEKHEQEARNAKRRDRAERRKQEQQDADDLLQEQESNYLRDIGDSLRRY